MIRIFHLSISTLVFLALFAQAAPQGQQSFDIFTFVAPSGFTLMESGPYLFYNKSEGKDYCQLFLYPAVSGQRDAEKDFATHWDFFARNSSENVNDPETQEADTHNGWQALFGAARGSFNKQMFAVTLSTFTKEEITYYIAAVFTNEKFIPDAQAFIASVVPDEKKFLRNEIPHQQVQAASPSPAVATGSSTITWSTTHFDDGWTATLGPDYVQVAKAGTELRLHYIDKALDDARPNTIDAPEYYWVKYVEPYFTVSNLQKWSGAQYPVIYHLQANAVEKQTGKPCFVAIKIVYNGGARPIVVIAPNQNSYQQQFPHPNDLDPMLNANRFAITADDIMGTWQGSGGGGTEYYHAYSGTYAGMSAISSTDEFTFNLDGTYSSTFRSASMNAGSTQFVGQDFKGTYSVADRNITVSNRHGGKTTTYHAQLIAVKGGYLLYISDSDNPSMNYTLFKSK